MSPWLEINKPPVAKIAGNVVVTLPTSTAELDGSRSSDDKGIVSYLWTRDETSPAAGVSVPGCDQGRVLPSRIYFNHVAPISNYIYIKSISEIVLWSQGGQMPSRGSFYKLVCSGVCVS